MRIISGKYKGKKLEGFNIEGTRPTMDRVKESLFGIIQNNIKDSIVLDLFAGSGSLGMETLSNGASICYFVDNSDKAVKVLKKNSMGIKDAKVMKSDYLESLEYFKKNNYKFDIIFLDPPYKLNIINDSIKKILSNDLLNKNGLIVCEYENEKIECNLKLIKEKKYGTTYISIYKKI